MTISIVARTKTFFLPVLPGVYLESNFQSRPHFFDKKLNTCRFEFFSSIFEIFHWVNRKKKIEEWLLAYRLYLMFWELINKVKL